MTEPYSATIRTGVNRRDPKSTKDRRILAKKLFPDQEITIADTCQSDERRESSRRIRSERRH